MLTYRGTLQNSTYAPKKVALAMHGHSGVMAIIVRFSRCRVKSILNSCAIRSYTLLAQALGGNRLLGLSV